MRGRLLLAMVVLVFGARTVLGFAVGLTEPRFFFPAGVSAEVKRAVVAHAKGVAEFQGGWDYPGGGKGASTQWYGGDGAALQELLRLLVEEAGIEVEVRFVEGKDRKVAFSVFQDGTRPGYAKVQVNLRKSGLDLSGLVLGYSKVGGG